MRKSDYILITFFTIMGYSKVFGSTDSTIKLHTDFITTANKNIVQDFFFISDTTSTFDLSMYCYKKNKVIGDSILIARSQKHTQVLKVGLTKVTIDLTKRNAETFIDPTYATILTSFGIIPPGEYVIYTKLTNSLHTYSFSTIRQFDSVLLVQSALHKDIQQDVFKIANAKNTQSNANTEMNTSKMSTRIDCLLTKKGITRTSTRREAQLQNDLYYENIFLGRYTLDIGKQMYEKIKNQYNASRSKVLPMVKNELDNYQSLFSQMKTFTKMSKDDKPVQGEIGVTANLSNQNEAYSEQDKNFYEFNGNAGFEVLGIPVQIEGYYTTQDIDRKIKSSFIHFHYDVQKAKSSLMELVGGYKSQYEQTVSKGKGLEGIYNGYIKNLQNQKSGMLLDLARQSGINEIAAKGNISNQELDAYIKDTSLILQKIKTNVDTGNVVEDRVATLKKNKDSLQQVYTQMRKKYEEIKVVQEKIEKYVALVEQYKNTNYFDSLMTYDKIRDLKDYEDMSYKDLAKKSSELLPEGRVKQVSTGLTNLDVGMFPKYASQYTMSGQMIKGVDVGYDVGFAETAVTVGKTEYIGRDGNVDKYTCYSGRVAFKPIEKQKVSVIYYGYSPSRRMFTENKEFFANIDAAYPTFKNPVHILSLQYQGDIYKGIKTNAEIASSFKQKIRSISKENIVYSIGLEGDIPKTPIQVIANYEHTGKNFENNTMPFSLAGTERLKLGAKSIFFQSFLHVGLEFNQLIQHNTTNDSKNTRWGFDIQTRSKQYPCLSLSYKPFSTFRSFADTLGIPQRPLLGEVWTGKLTYKFKKNSRTYHLLALYNKSNSSMDTAAYANDLIQVNLSYLTKKIQSTISLSNSNNSSTIATPNWHARSTYIVALNGNFMCSSQVSLQGGLDLGLNKISIINSGINGGVMYKMKKVPLTYRLSSRYSRFKVEESGAWKNRIGGVLGVVCGFNIKG